MKKTTCSFLLVLMALAILFLGSCGGGEGDGAGQPFLGRFTAECPDGPLAFWTCNMTWDQQCWQ